MASCGPAVVSHGESGRLNKLGSKTVHVRTLLLVRPCQVRHRVRQGKTTGFLGDDKGGHRVMLLSGLQWPVPSATQPVTAGRRSGHCPQLSVTLTGHPQHPAGTALPPWPGWCSAGPANRCEGIRTPRTIPLWHQLGEKTKVLVLELEV